MGGTVGGGGVRTLAELAGRLGLSVSTVAKALAGDAKIAAATRARVGAAVEETGYQPNPAASLMAKMRHRRRAESGRLTIAALATMEEPLLPSVCEQRGVELVQIVMREEDDPRRLLETLWHRGISGILLWPDPWPWKAPHLEKLPWHRFPVVKLARVRPELSFHLIRHAAFDFAALAVRRSCEAATSRVCVLLWETESDADNQARLGALLAYRENRLPPGIELEWRMWQGPFNRADPEAIEWLLERGPDTVLLFHDFMLYALEQGGLPDWFCARFHAILHDRRFTLTKRPLAGCEISRESYLRRALDLLLDLIKRGERGLVAHPMELVIEPVWSLQDSN